MHAPIRLRCNTRLMIKWHRAHFYHQISRVVCTRLFIQRIRLILNWRTIDYSKPLRDRPLILEFHRWQREILFLLPEKVHLYDYTVYPDDG